MSQQGIDLHTVGFKKKNIYNMQSQPCLYGSWNDQLLNQFTSLLQEDTAPEIYKNRFFEICNQYRGYSHFCTDDSRIDDQVDSAVVLIYYKPEISRMLTYISYVKVLSRRVARYIWNCCENNKLHSIYHTVGSDTCSKSIYHCDSVVIGRLPVGHSSLTHFYLLSNDDVPLCETCGLPLTIKHILVECPSF